LIEKVVVGCTEKKEEQLIRRAIFMRPPKVGSNSGDLRHAQTVFSLTSKREGALGAGSGAQPYVTPTSLDRKERKTDWLS